METLASRAWLGSFGVIETPVPSLAELALAHYYSEGHN